MRAQIAQAAKALVAAVLAGLAALSAYLVNDTSIGSITAGQWVQVAIAVVAAGAFVYGVPNAKAP